MPSLDLTAVAERYHRALNAKPGKGPISEAGIAAITDSVCDIPALITELHRFRNVASLTQQAARLAEGSTLSADQILDAFRGMVQHTDLMARAEADEHLAEIEHLRDQNQRLASRLGGYATSMQDQLDPLFAAMGRVKELAEGWAQMFDNAITPEGEAVRDAGRLILQALAGQNQTDGRTE